MGHVHYVATRLVHPEVIVAQRSGMLIASRGPGYVESGDCVAVVARPRNHVGKLQKYPTVTAPTRAMER